MACNCKANKQIMKIYKNYGNRIKTPWVSTVKFNFFETLKTIILIPIILLSLPLIFIYIIFQSKRRKSVFNVNNFVNFLMRKKKNE